MHSKTSPNRLANLSLHRAQVAGHLSCAPASACCTMENLAANQSTLGLWALANVMKLFLNPIDCYMYLKQPCFTLLSRNNGESMNELKEDTQKVSILASAVRLPRSGIQMVRDLGILSSGCLYS